MDVPGVIDEIGPDVTRWQVGDEVVAMALLLRAHDGAFVQELVAPVRSFTRNPRGTSIEAAATVPINGCPRRRSCGTPHSHRDRRSP
ncbi:hypothetical protein DEI91_14760 [Curtobacterium sp. MCBD17_032]|nr:hypothetical protein DEI91_14760 [Curtobacterium sp. MCBD17_032]